MRNLRLSLLIVFITAFLSPASATATNRSPLFNIWDLPVTEFVSLSSHSIAKLTGHTLNLKERVAIQFLKISMKKAVRHNHHITMGQFFSSNHKSDVLGTILIVFLAAILLVFIYFLVIFQDKKEARIHTPSFLRIFDFHVTNRLPQLRLER